MHSPSRAAPTRGRPRAGSWGRSCAVERENARRDYRANNFGCAHDHLALIPAAEPLADAARRLKALGIKCGCGRERRMGHQHDRSHPSDPDAWVGLSTAIEYGHNFPIQFEFISLHRDLTDLTATNAYYASKAGTQGDMANGLVLWLIDLEALAEYAAVVGLEIMLVDVSTAHGANRHGLTAISYAFSIASRIAVLFLRSTSGEHGPRYRKMMMPPEEDILYHSTPQRPLRKVMHLITFSRSDLPLRLQNFYAADERARREQYRQGEMNHWRGIWESEPNVAKQIIEAGAAQAGFK